MELPFDPHTVGIILFCLGSIAWACFERLSSIRSKDRRKITDAEASLHQVLKEDRDAWKARYETEHDEYKKHREDAHAATQAAQQRIFQLNEMVSSLTAKTDVTPIMNAQKAQNEINQSLLAAVAKIMESLDKIAAKLSHHEQ